jgi:hypothetical protein
VKKKQGEGADKSLEEMADAMNEDEFEEIDLSLETIEALRVLAIASLEHGTPPDDLTAYRICRELLRRRPDCQAGGQAAVDELLARVERKK